MSGYRIGLGVRFQDSNMRVLKYLLNWFWCTMRSSGWQKRNKLILYSGLMITLSVTGFLRFLSLPNTQEIGLMILVMVTGLTLTYGLKNRYPDMMVRRLRYDFETAVGSVQKVLRDNNIRFYRHDEEESVSFKVFELTMTLIPYEVEKLTHIEPNAKYTLVTLEGLNKQNAGLTKMVTVALNKIDGE